MQQLRRAQEGFTMMELIIIIAVIGILSALVMTSVVSAQAKGRDSKRRHDVAAIRRALIGYSIDNGTALVEGSGKVGTGNDGLGWFNFKGGEDYTGNSIEEGLRNRGYLSGGVADPRDPDNGYVIFPCATSDLIGVFVTVEQPAPEDEAKVNTWIDRGCPAAPIDTYNKNTVEIVPLNN